MNKPVIVYSAEGCVDCTHVKQMLKEEEIAFEVRDVFASEEYRKEVEEFGFMGIPVTVIGDQAVKGFTPELKELIYKVKN